MNWSRYSNVALAVLLVAVAAAAPVAAVSVSAENGPDAVEVGVTQDVTYEVSDLYTNYDQWSLEGETDLENVTWTVTTYDVGDTQLEQTQYNSQSFSHDVAKDSDVARVTVRLQGTTPEWNEWSYEPAQNLTVAQFSESQQDGASSTLDTDTARPHTEDSQNARSAIESADNAVANAESAGASTGEAESLIENAISAYENGNFDNADSLASQAENEATSAQQSTEQTNMLLWGGAGVLALLIVLGIVYWYMQQRETYDKLG